MEITIAEQRINYVDEGDGDAVLVLHGWGAQIDTVKVIHDFLVRNNFRAISVDLPGFGKSPKPDRVWGSFEYAELMKELLSRLQINKVNLIGHSFGGKISLIMSCKYSEIVNKVIVISASGIRLPLTFKKKLKRLSAKTGKFFEKHFGKTGKSFKRMVYRRIASQDYLDSGEMKEILVRVVNEDIQDNLPDIKVPVLLVWGKNDGDTPLQCGKIMEKAIPDAGLVVIENAGHYSYLEQFNFFSRVLINFFRSSS